MDCKELMIGDWVHIDTMSRVPPHNDQVRKIFEKYCDTDNSFIGWEYVEGIPLSEDILKANGFELKEEINNCTRDYFLTQPYCKGVQWCHVKVVDVFKDGIAIDMEASDYSMLRGNNSFKYLSNANCCVHEFQHALRLCGLNELADNFKLEEQDGKENNY